VASLLPREPCLKLVNYGSFQEALNLLLDPTFAVENLLGDCFPLTDYGKAFDRDASEEGHKLFLVPNGEVI
jgi:hypothetical protein